MQNSRAASGGKEAKLTLTEAFEEEIRLQDFIRKVSREVSFIKNATANHNSGKEPLPADILAKLKNQDETSGKILGKLEDTLHDLREAGKRLLQKKPILPGIRFEAKSIKFDAKQRDLKQRDLADKELNDAVAEFKRIQSVYETSIADNNAEVIDHAKHHKGEAKASLDHSVNDLLSLIDEEKKSDHAISSDEGDLLAALESLTAIAEEDSARLAGTISYPVSDKTAEVLETIKQKSQQDLNLGQQEDVALRTSLKS